MAPIVLLRGSEVCLCIAEQRMNKVRMSASEGITDIARAGRNRSKVTHLRTGGCIAAVVSILAAGEEPSPATQRITPRAFALSVQSNSLLRQEIVD
jgi:hypothetical protein